VQLCSMHAFVQYARVCVEFSLQLLHLRCERTHSVAGCPGCTAWCASIPCPEFAQGLRESTKSVQVVKRHLVYAIAIVSVVAIVVYTQQGALVRCFTGDAAVVAVAATALPLVAAAFPLDATSSILDGTLTAAGQATWTATNTTAASLLTFTGLLVAERCMQLSLLWVWVFLKLMTLLRLPMLLHRTFYSANSPFAGAMRSRVAAVDEHGVQSAAAMPAMRPQVSAQPVDALDS
jgi:MatE